MKWIETTASPRDITIMRYRPLFHRGQDYLHLIPIDAIMDNKKAAVNASNGGSGGDSGAGPQPNPRRPLKHNNLPKKFKF